MTIRIRKLNDEAAKFERSAAWREVSLAFRRRNPICQAIENGEQCHKPAELVHHLASPAARPDLRIDWSNLVSLCAGHHTPHAGDPGRLKYAPTELFDGSMFEHKPEQTNQLAPTGGDGRQFIANTPDDETMAKLMADCADVDDLLKPTPPEPRTGQ